MVFSVLAEEDCDVPNGGKYVLNQHLSGMSNGVVGHEFNVNESIMYILN